MKKQAMKINTMKNQKGMTLISWMVVLAFAGFQFMLAIRIMPVFAEDHTITSIWKALETDIELVGKSPKDIHKSIQRKFKINNVKDIDPRDIVIRKSEGYNVVTLEYEPRGKLVGPLDFIVSFKHEAKIKSR
ncbi:MAG: DUF4845 domain-containing protein [Gammaproteobacteria bacterium]|nr:DUF4845 domain-containing protein [Gammaproteobacteria bacterium]